MERAVNQKRLPLAIVALVLVAGIFSFARSSHTPASDADAGARPTLPSIATSELSSMVITRPGAPALTLRKLGDAWQLTTPVTAKVDQSAVDTMVEKLGALAVTGVAATRKENHARLEVDAEHAIHVVAQAKDKPVLDFYLGVSSSGGTMLRLEGEDQVLALKGSVRYAFDKDADAVRNRTVTDLRIDELRALEVSSPKGSYRFERAPVAEVEAGAPNARPFQQAPGEKPIKGFSPDVVLSLASALTQLRASGFATPGDSLESTGIATASTKATLTMQDGRRITLTLGAPSAGGADYYLTSSDSDVIFRVSKLAGDRLSPDAAVFEAARAKPDHAQVQGNRIPVAGGGNLPPEVLKQLQQQLGQAHSP
jgi:hypothetical protein